MGLKSRTEFAPEKCISAPCTVFNSNKLHYQISVNTLPVRRLLVRFCFFSPWEHAAWISVCLSVDICLYSWRNLGKKLFTRDGVGGHSSAAQRVRSQNRCWPGGHVGPVTWRSCTKSRLVSSSNTSNIRWTGTCRARGQQFWFLISNTNCLAAVCAPRGYFCGPSTNNTITVGKTTRVELNFCLRGVFKPGSRR